MASDLSPKIIQNHVDSLWTLGGEIRHLNQNPSLRRKSIEQILDDGIDDEGGPPVYTPWNRKNRYCAPSIPLAGSSTVSLAFAALKPAKPPTNSPDEA